MDPTHPDAPFTIVPTFVLTDEYGKDEEKDYGHNTQV